MKVGSTWLIEQFPALQNFTLTHESTLGSRLRIDSSESGVVRESFPQRYHPGNQPLAHVEFALKYDDLNLEFLKAVFRQINDSEVAQYILTKPTSKYRRQIGFLYEFLTGKSLSVESIIRGNYVPILDPERYAVTPGIRDGRWRINNNLLGTQDFCPIVRLTTTLKTLLSQNDFDRIRELAKDYPPEIFRRMNEYLYLKETRSSFEIEHEHPSNERVTRFMNLLRQAGEVSIPELLTESSLTRLQNEIVDPRFANQGFRINQNYIGQTLSNWQQKIHYVCPPPELVPSLMAGLAMSGSKSQGVSGLIRAAILSFGFVFIHPFEDGNGRIHRFLIHDMLCRDALIPKGTIIPISASMLNHRVEYDQALEAFSQPLMQRVQYSMSPDQALNVNNASELEDYYRYPDLTQQTEYLARTIKKSITEDMASELIFIQRYDEMKKEIQTIVDLPDRELNLLIQLLHQNQGKLANRKRSRFQLLSDDEISRIEMIFQEIFALS